MRHGDSPKPARRRTTPSPVGPAPVTESAPTRIRTAVPGGAGTGTITVTAPLGSATSQAVFRVLGELTVTPSTASVFVNRTQQFQALEAGTATTNVRWAVNDLPGGDATVGTVSADGLYSAPSIAPNPSTVRVTAIHKDDSTLTASATVTIMPPQPAFIAARAVSVGVAEARTVNQNVTAMVSIAVAESRAAFAAAAPTAVAVAPAVTAVTPATGARGATFTLTLSGSGFGGATAVAFLDRKSTDPAITVSNLVV